MSYSRLAVLVALVVGGVGFVLWLIVKPQMPKRPREREAQVAGVEVHKPFLLPAKTIDATRLLGHPRDAVRAVLGTPAEERGAVDRFEASLPVLVRYENGVAVGLQLTAPRAGDNVDLVRKWLKLPLLEPMIIDGARYAIGGVEDDADVVVVEKVADVAVPKGPARVESREPAAKRAAPTSGGGVVLAAEIVRGFPLLPPDLAARCEGKPQSHLMCSRGVDAKVAYDKEGSAATLTVLGPPGTSTLESCRSWIQRVVPDTSPAGRANADDEIVEFFRKGEVRYALRWLTTNFAGSGARCTISACVGGASACR